MNARTFEGDEKSIYNFFFFFFFRIRSIYNLKQLFLQTLFEWTNLSIFTFDSLADLIDCYYFYAL